MFNSTIAGDAMAPSMARLIPLELAAMSGEKSITISGGGEPLLWLWIVSFVCELLKDMRNKVHLITSGCKDEFDTGYRTLQALSTIRHDMFRPTISYTPYNPTSEERLRFTLPLLTRINGRVYIKLTMDYEHHETMEELASVLLDMGYNESPIMPAGPHSLLLSTPGHDDWVRENANFCEQAFWQPYKEGEVEEKYQYFVNKHVVVYPQTLALHGRGVKLYGGTLRNSPDFTYIDRKCSWLRSYPQLCIDTDGAIYPCSTKLSGEEASHLSLGKLGETRFADALANRETMASKLRRHFITSNGFNYDLCEVCRNDGSF